MTNNIPDTIADQWNADYAHAMSTGLYTDAEAREYADDKATERGDD